MIRANRVLRYVLGSRIMVERNAGRVNMIPENHLVGHEWAAMLERDCTGRLTLTLASMFLHLSQPRCSDARFRCLRCSVARRDGLEYTRLE